VAHDTLRVVVGHVSEQNNHPELLEQAFEPLKDRVSALSFATQTDGVDWVDVDGESGGRSLFPERRWSTGG
jgi:hypothetical protein